MRTVSFRTRPVVLSVPFFQIPLAVGRRLRWWIVPQVSILPTSLLYVSILIVIAFDGNWLLDWPALDWLFYWPALPPIFSAPLVGDAMGAIVLLAVVDRIDAGVLARRRSVRTGGVLLVVRLLLISLVWRVYGVAGQSGWTYTDTLLLVVPFLAAHHFDPRGVYAVGGIVLVYGEALAWLEHSPHALDPVTLVVLAVILVIVAGAGTLLHDEQKSGKRTEALLATLERTHADLQAYASEVLAATEERHQLARAIHNQLGQGLAAVSAQLDTALAIRAIDAPEAEQAVRAAKQCASEALQDVRRSVGTLRAPRGDLGERFAWSTVVDPSPVDRRRPWWSVWLLPRTFDLVPTVMLLVFLAISVSWSTDDGRFPLWSWQSVAATLAVAGLLAVDRIEYLRYGEMVPRWVRLALVILRLVLCGVVVVTGLELVVVLFALMQYVVFINYGTKWGLGALAVGWGIYVGVNVWAYSNYLGLFEVRDLVVKYLGTDVWYFLGPGPSTNVGELVSSVVFLVVISVMMLSSAQMMMSERASRRKAEGLLADLARAHGQLQAYALQALATTDERNHLAREIHDGLGHYLTVINVQLEKALAFRAVDPAVADQAIQDARRLVSDALREVHGSLSALASPPDGFDLRGALRQLVVNVGAATRVDLQVQGQEADYAPQSLLVLYRVAQEGLTNVQKHAQAREARVTLTFGTEVATLEIGDDGRGFEPSSLVRGSSPVGAGYGLPGVRERVELMGGDIACASAPGHGTTLRVVVPKDVRTPGGVQRHGRAHVASPA